MLFSHARLRMRKAREARGLLLAEGVTKPAAPAVLVMLLALLFSLPYLALSETELPALSASDETLFKGEMGKGVKIQMKLQRDGSNLYGTYLYEIYGRDLELKGTINERGEIVMQEYAKGKNTGSFKGKFVSKERLEGKWFKPGSDKGRPFFVVMSGAAGPTSDAKEPPIAAAEGAKAQAAPRPVPKEQSQPKPQSAKAAPQPAPTQEPARSAAAPASKTQKVQSEPAAVKAPIPVVQELPLVQQEAKPKAAVESVRPNPEPAAKAPEQPKLDTKEQAPNLPAAAEQEAPKPAAQAVNESPAQSQSQEKSRGVAGRVINAVSARSLPPWVSLVFNLKALAAFGGILLLGGGLAWLAIVAGGMAGFRDNSAMFRQAYSRGLAFLPGVFMLALGVGAVLAVFVE
jgi:hypothetical protein